MTEGTEGNEVVGDALARARSDAVSRRSTRAVLYFLFFFFAVALVFGVGSGVSGIIFTIEWMPDYDMAVVVGSIAALWLRSTLLAKSGCRTRSDQR